jgi:hypothetical protein
LSIGAESHGRVDDEVIESIVSVEIHRQDVRMAMTIL